MAYVIQIAGPAGRLRQRLVEWVGAAAVEDGPATLAVWATDQAELIGIMRRLHDLGVAIDGVERTPARPPEGAG